MSPNKNVRDLPAYRLLLPHVQVLLLRAKPNVTWETTEPHYIAYLPKTVAYDFHAISSLFHLAFCIRAFAPFELSAPITITHYAGPAGVHSIKHSYYFKPISNMIYKTVMQPPQVITL